MGGSSYAPRVVAGALVGLRAPDQSPLGRASPRGPPLACFASLHPTAALGRGQAAQRTGPGVKLRVWPSPRSPKRRRGEPVALQNERPPDGLC